MSGIFRTYDIRGVYPTDLDEKKAETISQAFFQYLNEEEENKRIVVGYDARLSSEKIKEGVVKGLIESGAEVKDIGLSTTPLLNFAVVHYNQDAGIMVTASHNPPEYNGLKLIGKHALQYYYKKGINKVETIYNSLMRGTEEYKLLKGSSAESHKEVLNDYVDDLIKHYKPGNIKREFAVEFLNGVGSITAKPFFNRMHLRPRLLHQKPDGNFPNGLPNPIKEENLEELKKTIKENNLDFGVAFDGDADRLVLVDERGNFIPPDFLFGLLMLEELKKKKGTIYVDLRFSRGVIEVLREHGANVVVLRVGNPFYKEALFNDSESIGAAELSGHIMFKEHYNIDDGLFTLIKVLNIATNSDRRISDMLMPFYRYYRSEEINFRLNNDEEAERIMNSLARKYKDGKQTLIDGLKVDYEDWWFSIRKSNTEPLVRLIVEAKSKRILNEKRLEIEKEIRRFIR